MNAEKAFATIESALVPRLKRAGFVGRSSGAHPLSFGSRYCVYESEYASLRLVWDGKERILSLECDRFPKETKPGPWLDLTVAQFDLHAPDAEVVLSAIAGEFDEALCGYLRQFQSPDLPDRVPSGVESPEP